MQLSKIGSFFAGILAVTIPLTLALHFFQNTEAGVEKLQLIALVLIAIASIGMILDGGLVVEIYKKIFLKPNDVNDLAAFVRVQSPGKKQSNKSNKSKIKVESNTEEIHSLLNDLAQKTRQANEMFFQQKLELQNKSILELTQAMGLDSPNEKPATREVTDPSRKIKI